MAITSYSKFDTYKSKIFSLSSPIEEEALLSSQFLLEKDDKKKLEIYYAPFDYVNEQAKIVIVGITPGLHQMKRSYETVRNLRDNKVTDEEILHQVKKNSSFEGPMRKNLIKMLDELQLHQYLGLSSTSELFNTASHLVQTTSIITYPVFYNGKNYNGSVPNLLKTELLKKYVMENFTSELKKLQDALIIPLGVNVTNALTFLAENDYMNPSAVLFGFPHPSGGNGHRHKQFAENKENMKQNIQAYFD
ncbi:uracil-DNA glycosylase family protein [Ectobacillus sp. sgz5001026]|uniref:uracil-DNA glycosylase family protein n=1 Tax=Ectobacillus sp. sgz5001026 TaxID=3242473 RepID=UPI0036D38B45